MTRFTNGIYGLQLAETPDCRLTGQLDDVVVNATGKIEYTSFIATGIADGGSISLTFKQASMLPTTLSGSGTIEGDRLSLTGDINPGRLSTVVFVRASDAQYQSAVNGLINDVNKAASAKAIAENHKNLLARRHAFAPAVEQLVTKMQGFGADADTHLARWPGAEQSYRDITAKMNAYLNQECSLVGNTDASIRRGQIAVAIDQTSISADQIHYSAMSLQNNFEATFSPLLKMVETAVTRCSANDIPSFGDEVKNACADISRESQSFRQKYAAFSNGLVQLEGVYRVEHKRQEELVQASERME